MLSLSLTRSFPTLESFSPDFLRFLFFPFRRGKPSYLEYFMVYRVAGVRPSRPTHFPPRWAGREDDPGYSVHIGNGTVDEDTN